MSTVCKARSLRRALAFAAAALAASSIIFAACSSGGSKEQPAPTSVPLLATPPGGTPGSVAATATRAPTVDRVLTPTGRLSDSFPVAPVTPGAACPVATAWTVPAIPAYVFGPGPVLMVPGVKDAHLKFTRDANSSGSRPVAWASRPEYDGPVILQGQRLDGEGAISFRLSGSASAFAPAITLESANATPLDAEHAPGWRRWATDIAVTAPGCYAIRMDGGFAYVMILAFDAAE